MYHQLNTVMRGVFRNVSVHQHRQAPLTCCHILRQINLRSASIGVPQQDNLWCIGIHPWRRFAQSPFPSLLSSSAQSGPRGAWRPTRSPEWRSCTPSFSRASESPLHMGDTATLKHWPLFIVYARPSPISCSRGRRSPSAVSAAFYA